MAAKKRFFPDITSQLSNTQKNGLFVEAGLPQQVSSLLSEFTVLLDQFSREVSSRTDVANEDLIGLYNKYKHNRDYLLVAVDEVRKLRELASVSTKRAKVSITDFMPTGESIGTPSSPLVIEDDDDFTFDGLMLAPQPEPDVARELDNMFERAKQQSQWYQSQQLARKWRRFIGSIEIISTATRPTVKPLVYRTAIVLKLLNPKTAVKGKKAHDVSVVRAYLKEADREIARIPEDLTRILAPLLDYDMVEVDLFVLFDTPKRLLTGDLFYIQSDLYLTHRAFEAGEEMEEEVAPSQFVRFATESAAEYKLRRRQTSIQRLFNRLGIRPHDSLAGEDDEVVDGTDSDVSLDHLKRMYLDTHDSKLLTMLPETTEPPSLNFKLDLRPYQKHGLSWMLTREKEYDLVEELLLLQSTQARETIRASETTVDPLWCKYKWPQAMENMGEFFYANMHSGEMSVDQPMVRTTTKGGILADEMGLGKTISALALVNSCPYDTVLETGYAHQTTLIVVPMSLLSQWKSEFDKANNNPNHYCKVYYGENTETNLAQSLVTAPKSSGKIPVVMLTTYGTVVNEYVRLHKRRTLDGALPSQGVYSVEFFRIILDEGHNIRNRATKTAKLIYEVKAKRKWVLTGTPIINRLDDLYAMVKFLDLNPWSDFSRWKSFITVPFENKQIGQTLEVIKLILEPIFLRRTKLMKQSDGTPLVELPPKEVVIESVEFSDHERMYYDWFKAKATQKFREGVKSGHLLKQYTQILTHILRLRQICCHVNLVKQAAISDLEETAEVGDIGDDIQMIRQAIEANTKLGFTLTTETNQVMYSLYGKFDPEESECLICTTVPIPMGELTVTPCGHTFCLLCILEHLKFEGTSNSCPNCRLPLTNYKLFKLRANDHALAKEVRFMTQGSRSDEDASGDYPYRLFLFNPDLSSSKIRALIKLLLVIKEQLPGEKVIVFSQFSSYLDLIEQELKSQGQFSLFKFDGRLSMVEREKLLEKFNQPAKFGVTVLLLSLKAGGVGLNLTTANKAFMMDPWWLPSIEDQAIDRIHRIGQSTSVKVVRFIMESSIEEKMLKIQERKKHLGEAVGAEEEQKQRRIEEIQIMFED